MLSIFYGTDYEGARTGIGGALSKKSARVTRLIADNTSAEEILRYASATNLFDTSVVFLDHVFENASIETYAEEVVRACAASPTVFFALERKISAPLKKVCAAHAVEMCEHIRPEKKEVADFGFVHAFGLKDRSKAWVLYQEALLKGAAPEQLHGMLFWKVKKMYEAQKKPDTHAKHLLEKVALLPATSRRAGIELDLALERCILEG